MRVGRMNLRFTALPVMAVFAAACGGSSDGDTDSTSSGESPNGVFESAHPSGAVDGNGNPLGSGMDGAAAGTPGAGPAEAADGAPPPSSSNPQPNGGDNGATRAIEEADVIKVSGDRLYALSALGGLSVVDISDPDALTLLGRHRTTATPFEMYVRDDSVFVLYNGYGEYTFDEKADSWTFYQTSYVISLDTSEPTQISEQRRFEIEGFIADSRLIGDIMYVAAFDDSFCYRCGPTPETNVMSLDVSNPKKLSKVDELTFEERQSEFSWRRSLSATDERLYISGPRWGASNPEGSVVQVVDIKDADGVMAEGDRLEVAGQISSRWQMDEYDGVLRVVSQPFSWRGEGSPQVETWEIESSDKFVALGSTPLVLPRPETLQSVRFDGPRGYAITFEQTDPLFTIDLSDPATPTQMGELEMPGWVYHMEPRGDRLLGLGFDQGNKEGALTVSIFDVSDLATPTMLSRVNFGGEWAQLAEDQDRIQKSFQVLDKQELVLVPYSGWTYSESQEQQCEGQGLYQSGVQLIDWRDDTLALQGIAESQGQARRAFFVDDRLLTMSNERLETFDVSDRASPVSKSSVELAQVVNQVAVAGDTIVRIGNSWWNQELEATVSSLEELERFDSGKKVTLPNVNSQNCNESSWLNQVLGGDDQVYFVYSTADRRKGDEATTNVLTLDVSDPKKPRVAGDTELDMTANNGGGYVPGMVDNGQGSVAIDDSLVFARHDTEHNNLGFLTKSGYTLEVVDLSKPKSPEQTTVKMPDSLGSTGLVISGSIVATSHFELSPTNPDSVRFYLNRLDVTDPSDPELLPAVNIPGSLLTYNHKASRALTVDYQYATIEGISPKECYEEEFGQFQTPDPTKVDYEKARGTCIALRFKLHLVEIGDKTAKLVDSYDVDKGLRVTAAAVGSDRVFLGTEPSGGYFGGAGVAPPPAMTTEPGIGGQAFGGGSFGYFSYSFPAAEAKLLVASGLKTGKLSVASAAVETAGHFYHSNHIVARGKKAVVGAGWQGRLNVVDATDADKPVVQNWAELAGGIHDLDLAGNVAIAAMGQAGVQTLRLDAD